MMDEGTNINDVIDSLTYGQGRRAGTKRNIAAYRRHYKQLLTIAVQSCFTWEGVGDHIEPRFIEQTLFRKGLGIMYVQNKHEVPDTHVPGDDIITTPRLTFREAVGGGRLNDQFITTYYRTVQPTGPGRVLRTIGDLEDWQGVPIYDNMQHDSYIRQTINFQAERLTQAALTVDVNLANSRTQRIALIEDSQKKAAQMVETNVDEGNGIILAKRNGALSFEDAFKMLDFTVDPAMAEKNHGVFHRILGEAYTSLGIKGQMNEKGAQQTEEEVAASDSVIASIRLSRFDARRWAVDKINRRFGTAVRVIDNGTGE